MHSARHRISCCFACEPANCSAGHVGSQGSKSRRKASSQCAVIRSQGPIAAEPRVRPRNRSAAWRYRHVTLPGLNTNCACTNGECHCALENPASRIHAAITGSSAGCQAGPGPKKKFRQIQSCRHIAASAIWKIPEFTGNNRDPAASLVLKVVSKDGERGLSRAAVGVDRRARARRSASGCHRL